MLMETRDSLLLIVRWPAVRVVGLARRRSWTGPPAEGDVEILGTNHVVVSLARTALIPLCPPAIFPMPTH